MLVPLHLLFLIFAHLTGFFIHAATIGDGRTSLINGKPIDYRSGSCSVDGRNYASETSVPREDPCHYCICYRGKVDCYWKRCARIPNGCQVMTLQDNCNPSLYICEIPEKARNAPTYGRPLSNIESPARTLFISEAVPTTRSPSPAIQFSIRPARQPVIIPPSRELTPPERRDYVIETPSRHLTPPLKPAQQGRALNDDSNNRQPSAFGLRMKQKMRFKRSIIPAESRVLPHNIEEAFPVDFQSIVESHVRSKRAINGSGSDNHHHHHHHHEEEDRGCSILGVRYELGEVVGVATDSCQECRCAAQSLFCSPKCCFKPAPLQLAGDTIRFLEQGIDPQEGPQHPLYYIQSEYV